TACTTCVVHSCLNPRIIYNMVVCSVCRGTGVERPSEPAPPSATGLNSPWLKVALLPCVGLLLVVAVLSGMAYERASNRLREEADRFQREQVLNPNSSLTSEVRAKITMGMDEDDLRQDLGEPDAIKVVEGGLSSFELWTYRCRDGLVWVSL